MGENIFDCFQFLFFITTLTLVWTKEPCPHIQLWDARAKILCKDPSWYHCLESQVGDIKEKCIAPKFIKAGHYPVLLIGDTKIIERRCPPSLYQPNGQMSNQFKSAKCMYIKDLCRDDGEEACDDGSDVSDRMCRCDYKSGYRSFEYLLSNPKMKSCYEPRSKERGCTMFPCGKGKELNKAYQCITVCPYGYYRSEYDDLNCVPELSIPNSSTTTAARNTKIPTITKQTKEPKMKDEEPGDNTTTYGTIAVTCGATIIFTILICLTYRLWRNKYDMYCRPGHANKCEGGEKLRKRNNDSFFFREIKNMYKVDESIGCITVELPTGEKGTGTGFRVGEKYVMTAYHVVQEIYENFWREMYRRHKVGDNKLKPEDGPWILTDFITSLSLDLDTQMNLKHIGEEMIKHNCSITFGYVGEERGNTFSFGYDAPFISTKHDIAILELNKDSNFPFPAKLNVAEVNIQIERLHVLGHPEGNELTFDPSCSVICNQSDLDRTKERAIEHFTSLGEEKSNVEKEYKECEISSDHILFHCSEGTAHGASGSPLFPLAKKNRKLEVIGMLLKGYPKLYYNKYRNIDKANKHPELLIESGITVEMLKSLLKQHKLFELANDIFDQFDVKS
ncbi:uncharacterized protein LOC133187466 isoform X1 [Saccostrea echinata]|uniref:uncharacterized protein LOC133187466 isoform X1 n=1 Tax=Saccostrea echinata TaxID=191078 RepID=UPI002A829864|nr:uncharacterized protein LOC133187466 isoform X1 [Saccostrea echinata]